MVRLDSSKGAAARSARLGAQKDSRDAPCAPGEGSPVTTDDGRGAGRVSARRTGQGYASSIPRARFVERDGL